MALQWINQTASLLRRFLGPGEELVFTSQRPPEEVKAFLKSAPGGSMFRRGADVSIDKKDIEIGWRKSMENSFSTPTFRGEILPHETGTIIRGRIFGAGIRQFPVGLQIFFFIIIVILCVATWTAYSFLIIGAAYLYSKFLSAYSDHKITEFILDACSSAHIPHQIQD